MPTMDQVNIKDKTFALSIPESDILQAVEAVAQCINRDLAGQDPLFVCVLNGAFMFAADLMKRIDIPCEITFVKLSSYSGDSTTGTVKEIMGLNKSIEGRNVVVVEDIVDTGITMESILRSLRGKGFVEMDISAGDRRKMDVRCTPAGRAFLEEKYAAVLRLFEAYVDALGEEDILQLTRILDKIVSYEEQVQAKTNRGGAER